jgi:hypothetical protein
MKEKFHEVDKATDYLNDVKGARKTKYDPSAKSVGELDVILNKGKLKDGTVVEEGTVVDIHGKLPTEGDFKDTLKNVEKAMNLENLPKGKIVVDFTEKPSGKLLEFLEEVKKQGRIIKWVPE